MSYNIKKINKYGVKNDRLLVITNKNLYNIKLNYEQTKKCIPLHKLDGITISSLDESSLTDQSANGELILHVSKSSD